MNTGNKGPIEHQPGDWVCHKCGYLNWRRRKVCQTCFPCKFFFHSVLSLSIRRIYVWNLNVIYPWNLNADWFDPLFMYIQMLKEMVTRFPKRCKQKDLRYWLRHNDRSRSSITRPPLLPSLSIWGRNVWWWPTRWWSRVFQLVILIPLLKPVTRWGCRWEPPTILLIFINVNLMDLLIPPQMGLGLSSDLGILSTRLLPPPLSPYHPPTSARIPQFQHLYLGSKLQLSDHRFRYRP